uniref:Peroxisome assembly protein 26 n=1 Tax=Oryzias sinensis TaxID=183150 RepID=A0A8C7WRJ3_9TELE
MATQTSKTKMFMDVVVFKWMGNLWPRLKKGKSIYSPSAASSAMSTSVCFFILSGDTTVAISSRCTELKTGFCILGIQALAELNRWDGVLAWVLQQYERQEDIPAKIMQMCILLYSKVGEAAEMQEAASVWLNCPSNCGSAGFRTVAELYLLHILVPLGRFEEARQFIAGEVGGIAFAERKQAALNIVEEKAQQSQEAALRSGIHPGSEISAHPNSVKDAIIHKLEAMLRFLYRKVLTAGSGLFPLRRLFLIAVILYMLFSRLDPAAPSSFMWISKLCQLFKQMWRTTFGPYYQTLSQKE